MRLKCLIALPALAMLLGAAAAQELPPLEPRHISQFRAGYGFPYSQDTQTSVAAWSNALRQALKDADLATAADALAPVYGLSSAQMRELAYLWIFGATHTGDLKGSEYPPQRRDPVATQSFRQRWLKLVRDTRHISLVTEAASTSLDLINDCSAADFAALIEDATDPARSAWEIARGQGCLDAYMRFLAIAPDRATPGLVTVVSGGWMQPVDALPVYAWLLGEAGLARVAPADRSAYEAAMRRLYLELLFEAGLTDRAIALIEGLSPDKRASAFVRESPEFTVTVDGLPVEIARQGLGGQLQLYLGAGYALAGRTQEAKALLAALGDWKDRSWEEDVATLDHFLRHANEDPYPIAEKYAAGGRMLASATVETLRCRVFDHGDPCAASAPQPYRSYARPEQIAQSEQLRAAIAALHLPGYAEDRAPFAAALDAKAGSTGILRPAIVPPEPPRFAEIQLPVGFGRTRPPFTGWPKDMTALPEDFTPVRVERSESRVVAISISRLYGYGPSGGTGHYWVHLSDDGGKSWRSYFTGLAHYAPYVIFSTSNLPLIDGDTLVIEVEVIDDPERGKPYSGKFVPVRRTADRALRIPLAALTADSDGDGLTDLAARQLMLDRPPGSPGRPLIVGNQASCTGPLNAEQQALTAVFAGLQSPPAWATRWEKPLFVGGKPEQFACIKTDRLILLYPPDATNAMRLPGAQLWSITFNRAHTRGFFRWDGGIWHVVLENGQWRAILHTPPPPE